MSRSPHYATAIGRCASCTCGWYYDAVTRRGARLAVVRHEDAVMGGAEHPGTWIESGEREPDTPARIE